MKDESIIPREATRAVFLTPEGEILLMEIENPVSGARFWITPGGGREDGESVEEGLRREVLEETGLQDVVIGPLIWRREDQYTWRGKRYHQTDVFYLIEMNRFEPVMDLDVAPGEGSVFQGYRWWMVDEIRASSAIFTPRRLAVYLPDLIEKGSPNNVIDTGV